ncbi:MAG: homoserine O-succinyltransferase [Sphaerochaeta sp.]
MPVKINKGLSAIETLRSENIFFMTAERAQHQDIRPLQVAILNLMPDKGRTEEQFLRLLANTALQVEVTFLTTASYASKHTTAAYLKETYKTFDEVKDNHYDALIITGSPVEQMAFEEVAYWEELTQILTWAKKRVFSSLFVCWAAQAALYHHYGIGKIPLAEKLSGVYSHTITRADHTLVRGFDDEFYAPHSRHTTIDEEAFSQHPDLVVIARSDEAGLYLGASEDGRMIFVTGHSEYDRLTLDNEYRRDLGRGLKPKKPANYYDGEKVKVRWRSHANLLFANWLNYHVYQQTPYQIERIEQHS